MNTTDLLPLNLNDVESMLAELNWNPYNGGGFIQCSPSDTKFHASFWLQKFNQIDWVVGVSFPVVRIPDSTELREFINGQSTRPGNILRLAEVESGMTSLRIVSSFPAANLSARELNFLFLGLFLDGTDIGEDVIGLFGGVWKEDD